SEASLLTVAILKELGVPRIVARCFDRRHGRLLLAIGANEVLNPEEESGARLASRLVRPGILDQMTFGDVRLAEVEAPERFAGSSLAELDLRGRYGVTVVAVQRGGEVSANPEPSDVLDSGDVLVLLGTDSAIREVAALR
ncbi:MAG: TrkA family potassium uptake protein, partial [Acidobacteriota bacterium]